MSRRPAPTVSIQSIQDRSDRGTKNPYVVRWTVNGRSFSKSFPTDAAAKDFEAQLRVARGDGKRFDVHTGQPEEWLDTGVTVAEWATEWLAGDWPTLAPRSRKSKVEALERALPVLVAARAPKAPESIRADIRSGLLPDGTLPAWLTRWSLPLADLDRAACDRAFRVLGMTLEGETAAASTAGRYRKTVRSMLDTAVEAGHLAANPWPKPARGHAQRKASKKAKTLQPIDVKALPTPAEARKAISALRTHQPRSAGYELTGWIVYLSGMRPSEARALDIADCTLPETGWGEAWVHEADQRAGEQWTEAGEETGLTKTGVSRRVPLCPELVERIRDHIGDRTAGRVVAASTYSNLTRAWHRARKAAGGEWVLYDLRHLHASLAVSKGAQLGEVAARLGHSLETLVRVYAHALPGDAEKLNGLLEDVL